MHTCLYFVRHAHSIYSRDELGRPLSDRGSRDAGNIKHLFENKHVSHVISSPYQRALETVQGIADYFNIKVEIMDGFKERRLAETPVVDFDEAITSVWQDWDFMWTGGESNNAAQKRGILATIDILKKHSEKNVVIGTHGNIMVLIMNYFDQKYDYNFWRDLKMPDVYQLTFDGTNFVGAKHIISSEVC